jgi:hypothetical protein
MTRSASLSLPCAIGVPVICAGESGSPTFASGGNFGSASYHRCVEQGHVPCTLPALASMAGPCVRVGQRKMQPLPLQRDEKRCRRCSRFRFRCAWLPLPTSLTGGGAALAAAQREVASLRSQVGWTPLGRTHRRTHASARARVWAHPFGPEGSSSKAGVCEGGGAVLGPGDGSGGGGGGAGEGGECAPVAQKVEVSRYLGI